MRLLLRRDWLRGGEVGAILASLGIQVALLVSGIATARILGPTDRGYLALLALAPTLLVQLGLIGLPQAVTYELAQQRSSLSSITAALRRPVPLLVLLLVAVHAAVVFVVLRGGPTEVQIAAAVSLLAIPGAVGAQFGLAILQGQRKFIHVNVLPVLAPTTYAIGMLGILASGLRDLPLVTSVWIGSNAASGAVAALLARRRVRRQVAASPRTATSLRRLLRFGLRANIGASSLVQLIRPDQIVVAVALSPAALGIYIVSLALTNLPQFAAANLGLIAYPKIAGERDPRVAYRLVWRFVGSVAAVSGLVCLAALAAAEYVVVLLFGSEFSAAVPVARVLLIAAFFNSLRRAIGDGLRGLGRPGDATLAELVSWPTLALALFVLTPNFGLLGVASSLVLCHTAGVIVLGAKTLRLRHSNPSRKSPRALSFSPPAAAALCTAGLALASGAATGVLGPIAPALLMLTVLAGLFLLVAGRVTRGLYRDLGLAKSLGVLSAALAVAALPLNGMRVTDAVSLGDLFLAAAGVLLLPAYATRFAVRPGVLRWIVVSGGMLLVSGAVAAMRSGEPTDALRSAQAAAALTGTPLIIGAAAHSWQRLRMLSAVWVGGVAVSASIATSDALAITDVGRVWLSLIYDRAAGLAVHPNHLAITCAMALPSAIAFATSAPQARTRGFFGLAASVIVIGALVSGSRAGLVAMAAGTGVLLGLQRSMRTSALTGLVIIFAALAVAQLGTDTGSDVLVALRRVSDTQAVAESDAGRIAAYQIALADFADSPFVGTGFSSLRFAHNIYLQLLQAGGLLALGAFALFAVTALRLGYSLTRLPSKWGVRTLVSGLTGSITAWLIFGLAQNQIYDRYLYIPVGLLVGAAISAARGPADPAVRSPRADTFSASSNSGRASETPSGRT